MPQTRRKFLSLAAASAATAAAMGVAMKPATLLAAATGSVKGILFDAFPIFDPRPISALAESLYPNKGAELDALWRTKLFEYNWLRVASGRYADFDTVTEDALVCAARILKLDLTEPNRAKLLDAYLQFKAYPDVLPAITAFKASGLRLGFLSNLTPKMLAAGIKSSGLEGLFDQVLSTESARTFKPDPKAYRMGMDAFSVLAREEIVFVASAEWDAAGAKWFGYRTFWLNRLNLPAEELGITPDGVGSTMADLANFVKA